MHHTSTPAPAPKARRVVLILGSGPEGLDDARDLLTRMPRLSAPVLVAVTGVDADALASLLDDTDAAWASHDAPVVPGVWICPDARHTVARDGRFVVTPAEDAIVAPCVDKILYTARSEFRSRIVAIVSGDDISDSPCLRLVSLRGGSAHILVPADHPDASDQRATIIDEVALTHALPEVPSA